MIYFCADDYALNNTASTHIKQCIDAGALNKVSVFPNFESFNINEISKDKNIMFSLHLNLVEGKCLSEPAEINLFANPDGKFKYNFGGLLKLNLFKRKKFEAQIYKEIKAQVVFWQKLLPEDADFCIDSHQHAHMIPAIFKVLLKVLEEQKIDLKYIRIPAEPLSPFIKTPQLYLSYSPVNIIKQWLLKFLWLINKRYKKTYKIPTAEFFGILFSGNMDEKRVGKILPEYIKLAEKKGRDIEVLFHPGYLSPSDETNADVCFEKFYLSKNRKTEFDSLIKITGRSV